MKTITTCILVARLGLANIWYVDTDGSIQNAICQAEAQDTIILRDGIYTETVIPYGKTLVIASEYVLDGDTSHISNVLVRPDLARVDTGSCFVYAFGEGAGSELRGLTASDGTGTVWDVTNDFVGGAIYVHSANLRIRDCRITNSRAFRGAGIGVVYYDDGERPIVEIERSRVLQNVSDYDGGGLGGYYSSITAVQTVFSDNVAAHSGSNMNLLECFSTIDSCRFEHGQCFYGGIIASERSLVLLNSVFLFNGASERAGPSHLMLFRIDALVQGCYFGASSSATPSISFTAVNYYPPFVFTGNVIENNSTGEITGTIYIGASRGLDFTHNVIRDNVNSHGAAVQVDGPSIFNPRQCAFIGNQSNDRAYGSAIVVTDPRVQLTLDSCLIAQNDAPSISSGEEMDDLIHAENNWWGDPSGPFHPTLNPGGRGDTLYSDSVLFTPWLTSPPDTSGWLPAIRREHLPISKTWEVVAIYPNPFNATVTISLAGFTGNDFALTLYNLLGQQIDTIRNGAVRGATIRYTAPAKLASGVYFVVARDRQAVVSKKIVLLR